MMLKIILMLTVSALLGISGQIFYKKGLSKVKGKYLEFLKAALSKPMIWIGFCCISASLAIWFAAISVADLNIVNSLDSLSCILMLAASSIFLGEKIDKNMAVGTFLIAAGILAVAVT